MEAMFYIIAGTFNPSNDDFPVKTLITKDKFEDLDSYSLPDLYAGARRDVKRYVDALKEPLNDILRPLFENHTTVMSDDAGKSLARKVHTRACGLLTTVL